jgi:hypothetical protein
VVEEITVYDENDDEKDMWSKLSNENLNPVLDEYLIISPPGPPREYPDWNLQV